MSSVEGISDDFVEIDSLPLRSSLARNLQEKAANLSFHIASHLTEPMCKVSNTMHWIVSPFDPETSLAGKAQEIFCRALGWAAVSYTAVFSSAIAALGAIVRHTGVKIRGSAEFSHWRGKAPEKKLDEKKGYTLKSWDATALAGRSLSKGMPEPKQRAKEIIEMAKQKNPDVLCLFKIHDAPLAYSLYEELKGDYAHFYAFCGTEGHRPGNGGLIASKFHLAEGFSFHRFEEQSGWANQGFASFALSSNGKIFSRIITAEMDETSPQLREKQLLQIAKHLTEIHNQNPKKEEWIPKIFVGSTAERDSEEYHAELGFARFFQTGYQGSEPISTQFFLHKMWNPNAPGPEHSTTHTIAPMHRLLEGKNLLPPCCKIKVSLSPVYDLNNPQSPPSPNHSLFANVKVHQPLPETA